MLWSLKTNVLLLQQPKTGSTTIREHFLLTSPVREQYNRLLTHYGYYAINRNMAEVTQMLGRDPYEMKHYAFYRDPLDRFYSTCAFVQNQYVEARRRYDAGTETHQMYENSTRAFKHIFGVDEIDICTLSAEQFLAAIVKMKINNTEEEAPPPGCAFAMWDFFKLQSPRYLTERTHLLDFRRYSSEFRKVCRLLELPVPEVVLRLNESKNKKEMIMPKHKEQEVREFYASDYDFFAGRGVTF